MTLTVFPIASSGLSSQRMIQRNNEQQQKIKEKNGEKGEMRRKKMSYDLLINLGASFFHHHLLRRGVFAFFLTFLLHCFSIQVSFVSLSPDCV
jgi:hypothetical protein